MRTIVHVHQAKIRANIGKPASEQEPPLTVKTYKSNTYAYEVEILGPSRIVYSPDKPLSCGARVWVEVQGEVRILR